MSATTEPAAFSELSRLGVSRTRLDSALARFDAHTLPRLRLLWSYYRNPMEPGATLANSGGAVSRGLRLAQEQGLPARVAGNWSTRGVAAAIADDRAWSRKEVVIENDIAWRIHTMVDFMFGRPVTISSTARDPKLRRTIERVLDAIWESSGGIGLLQDMGLLGHVYGHVDLLIRTPDAHPTPGMRLCESRGSLPDSTTSITDDASTETPSTTTETPNSTNPTEPSSGQAGASEPATGATPREHHIDDALLDAARNGVRIELVDPTRGVALPGQHAPQSIDAYILRTTREAPPTDANPAAQVAGAFASVIKRWWRNGAEVSPIDFNRNTITTIEVFTRTGRQVFEQATDGSIKLIKETVSTNPTSPDLASGEQGTSASRSSASLPIIHIQNISQPFEFAGLSEVEPLIPLQDELNTRLSDRASRVTMLSFKMFLAKGVDGAGDMPVAPGIIWSTDNPDAQIQTFGGDAASPSEDSHIEQVREAMDKASGVPPLASGVVRAKIGNLSSENALKITLMGLLSKTARKRVCYGRGIAQASRLALEALDQLGILKTTEADRNVRIDWIDPLPRDERQALDAAKAKLELGVPRERVLSELGYGMTDPGVV